MLSKSDASGFWIYGWDFENRLITARKQNKTVRYQYDALGRRVLRHGKSVGINTKYTYDGIDVILDDSNGTLTKYQNGLAVDNKLKIVANGQAKYFLQDHLGSTVRLTDQSGAVLEQTNYDSFGNPTSNLSTRYQFTGREKDEFTGLMYYRARWFDANLGRFISEDPVGFAGGINQFAYVGNSPTNFADSLGLFPTQWLWKFHQNVTRRALSGLASESQIDMLAQEQQDFDNATQDEKYSPWHAMRRIGQSPEDARREANQFVRFSICQAQIYAKQGFDEYAMQSLGQAMHTLQDSTSPAHFDFQQSWENSAWGITTNSPHYYIEKFDPGAGSLADYQTIRAWGYFTGQIQMPDDFFIDNYKDTKSGWGDYLKSFGFKTGQASFSSSSTMRSPDGGKCGCK